MKPVVTVVLLLAVLPGLYSIAEDSYVESYTTVEKYYNENAIFGELEGIAESLDYRKALMYDLRDAGYSIYMHDHRGRGYTDRFLDDTDEAHIDDYRN